MLVESQTINKQTSSLSLYIHFPFCIKKCRYCDFYSVPYDSSLADDFIKAVYREWEHIRQKYALDDTVIKTIFCGGGTPSILSSQQWQVFHSQIISTMNIAADVEWTIECNPESFTEEKAEAWLTSGVNRLTVGVQSLNNRELGCMGRVHDADRALGVLGNQVLKKFKSVGVDIMYGVPGQSLASLEQTLELVLSFDGINHISAYELTIAEYTPFGRHKNILPLPSEDLVFEMTGSILRHARKLGFEQYEVSNYAKPGFECRHNKAYWSHLPYIGIGPSAHSYIHPQRFSNIKDIDGYINSLSQGNLPVEFTEIIDTQKIEHEMIFLRLRTREGLDENRFYELTGTTFNNPKRVKILAEMIDSKHLEYTAPWWKLTDKGMLFADGIAAKLY